LNELQFICGRKNVIQGRFKSHDKIYSWYLPYNIQEQIHIGDVEIIDTKRNRNKITVIGLGYEKDAKIRYKTFPYLRGIASWQIQHICRRLKCLGYEYSRERHFKGLTNDDSTRLAVDIVFYLQGHVCAIEYNGVHHYYEQGARYTKFEKKWCYQNNVPLLEIPFWWQNNLDDMLNSFIKSVILYKNF